MQKNNNKNYIRVGLNTCGIASGAQEVYDSLKEHVKKKNTPVEILKTGCIGSCFAEPIIEVKIGKNPSIFYQKADSNIAIKILEKALKNETYEENSFVLNHKNIEKIVLKNCGVIDPENINDYIENQGYQAIKKVLFDLPQTKAIDEIKKSNLRGRGGAGFPTGIKWENAYKINNQNKFIICNGDEGDPGAYMDRSVLEGDPHSVIEGMMIGGYLIGAAKGYFYIRAEYPLAIERTQQAIDDCYKNGFLGKNIFDSGFNFDLEIRIGAGAFVCGEETALIASIEGKRGYPRPRPPFPVHKGLWNNPTVINNVETLANITYIILNGSKKFAGIGTEKSKGTKVFALTGKVKNSCLVEVPMGTTIKEIIENLGGGISDNKELKAIQTGGPSGGLIPQKHLDTPVSYEHLENLGSIMGSGGMIVLNQDDCIVDLVKFFLGFCVDESCGKCAPCRIGSTHMLRILKKITEGRGKIEDIDKLERISHAMQNASLCGLGQTAPNPVISSLRYFKDEYIEHILENKCKAGKCNFK